MKRRCVNIGTGYRWLRVGETIRSSDEFAVVVLGRWIWRTTDAAGAKHNALDKSLGLVYRRRVKGVTK